MRRTKRNGKLCRVREGSDNFWDSRITRIVASIRQEGRRGEDLIMPRGTKQRCSPLRNNFVLRERENSPRRRDGDWQKRFSLWEASNFPVENFAFHACYLLDKVSTRLVSSATMATATAEDTSSTYLHPSPLVVSCNLTWSINAPNY